MRIVVQLLLVFPVLLISPLALPMGLVPFLPSFWGSLSSGRPDEFLSGGLLALGAYGILALPFAIFVPVGVVRKKRWLRVLLVSALAGGCLTSAYTFAIYPLSNYGWQKHLQTLWIYGAPVVVAVWSIVRFTRKEPNQALQTTPVTRSEF